MCTGKLLTSVQVVCSCSVQVGHSPSNMQTPCIAHATMVLKGCRQGVAHVPAPLLLAANGRANITPLYCIGCLVLHTALSTCADSMRG